MFGVFNLQRNQLYFPIRTSFDLNLQKFNCFHFHEITQFVSNLRLMVLVRLH